MTARARRRNDLRRVIQRLLGASVALVCLLTALPPRAAFGWGPEGHVLVARLAERYLSPRTKAALAPLLDGRRLSDLASWADDWRSFHHETSRWHFVDVPWDQATYDEGRDCARGACIVVALAAQIGKLGSGKTPVEERRRALRFVVHLVGDLHQPLHAIDHDDRGGNQVRAQIVMGQGEYPYRSMPNGNLHSVWDNDLLDSAHRDQEAYLAVLAHLPAPLAKLQEGDVRDWVNEAHALAQDPAYARLPPAPVDGKQPRQLDETYVLACRPVAERQIQKAGVRLARILNEALGAP